MAGRDRGTVMGTLLLNRLFKLQGEGIQSLVERLDNAIQIGFPNYEASSLGLPQVTKKGQVGACYDS